MLAEDGVRRKRLFFLEITDTPEECYFHAY
jgi:hypothetical protein